MSGESVRPAAPGDARSAGLGLVAVFTGTTFLSALLLFSIQPLFAKMVLPVLGGSPSVWAVALCFFQGALLAGYCYAHLLNGLVAARAAGFVHIAVCGLALLALPIAVPAGWAEPPAGDPYLWQLGLFTVAIGMPFLAVAANAPLLQAWFAASGHPDGRDPYFLYAASNLGSLIALLGYPFVLEPAFGARALAGVWAFGFVALIAAIAVCFWTLRGRTASLLPTAAQAQGTADEAPSWPRRLGWVGLALVPSALLTAFTTHITTDVASAPLLWVLPLALYLLTFVIVFRERALIPMRVLLAVHLAAVIVALLQLAQTKHDGWFVSSATGVTVFLTSALVAHRTLYDLRPAPRYLTEFYLWLSLGGVLGGLFAALIAPRLFSEVFEYPLLLALTMACRPGGLAFSRDREEWLRLWLVLTTGLLAIYWVPWLLDKLPGAATEGPIGWLFAWPRTVISEWGVAALLVLAFALLLLASWRHPPRQAMLALLMFLAIAMLPSSVKRGEAQRSYFGVYRVMLSNDGDYHILTHGTTLHGAQRIRDSEGAYQDDITPTTYYHPKSPMARTITSVRERLGEQGRKGRYGIIGLGTGSLACYVAEGERWRFFEIDPLVVRIASTPESFSFLHHCQPQPDIVLGDARLTMAREEPESFDLIIVDAFTSDAVPVHLMTAEALRLYASKLAPDGVVLLHISNRYLDLDSVLGATVPLVPELVGLILSDDEADGSYATSTSTVAIFSRSAAVIDGFRKMPEARELDAGGLGGWTDDFSDILGPLLARMRR
ncbi:MAG: fused MFS/spermidine synthase [Hyphomicrobiaceae bacterium]|nr:fused MFS/spermidine synthase [Hyphomicrobiaceae bacterium]